MNKKKEEFKQLLEIYDNETMSARRLRDFSMEVEAKNKLIGALDQLLTKQREEMAKDLDSIRGMDKLSSEYGFVIGSVVMPESWDDELCSRLSSLMRNRDKLISKYKPKNEK